MPPRPASGWSEPWQGQRMVQVSDANTVWLSWYYSERWVAPHVLLREAKELILERPVYHECEDLAQSLREVATANEMRGNLAAAESYLHELPAPCMARGRNVRARDWLTRLDA